MNKTAANLRWLRKTYGLTTKQVALGIERSELQVTQWELGTRVPGHSSYVRICRFFELNKHSLMWCDLADTHPFNERRWRRLHRLVDWLNVMEPAPACDKELLG